MNDNIAAAIGDPAGLERLYRNAQAEGNEASFKEALRESVAAHPGDVLLLAWVHRLDVAVAEKEEAAGDRHWLPLIGGSVVLGVMSALLAGGKPPVPAPGEASTVFWVSWGPLMALGLLAYLAWVQRATENVKRYAVAAVAVVALALYVGLVFGGRTGDAADLVAVHLPLLCWAIVGTALCLGYRDRARQAYGFLVKSVESVLTGGIFFGGGLLFVGLTVGIFKVLGIELPEEELLVVVAWGVGTIPLLAIGSAYDATHAPAMQDENAGLTRTLRILTRLMLPLALGVLVVYVVWFIPAYFWKAFEEREVLLVYNATIIAILILLTVVISGPVDAGQGSFLRYAVLALGALTLILNAYALAAVVSRALDAGLTPNRFTVIGWNVTTLAILVSSGVRLWIHRRLSWMPVLRESMGWLVAPAAIWMVVLLVVLPLFG
ncbi:MAG: hypothetical protein SH809_14010 [Rhodothermales bacterium]|nr:hypothetical protein [Rhodothermales bacterium]